MKIILSIDVELWSWRRNFELDVEKCVKKLVELARKEKIPITLFISLSDKGYNVSNYLKKIKILLNKIKNNKDIEFGIHTHCKNLPLEFRTNSDNLRDYDFEKIVKILRWYKKELEENIGKEIYLHRAGSWKIPSLNILEKCFKNSGLKIDSSDISAEYSKIKNINGFVEIPPATNKKLASRLRIWSADQMSYEEIINFYNLAKNHTNLLVMNFHSFRVYGELGKKARIWYKMPVFIQAILRPLIKIVKKKIINKNIELKEGDSFIRLKKAISYLKKDNCKFIKFSEFKK